MRWCSAWAGYGGRVTRYAADAMAASIQMASSIQDIYRRAAIFRNSGDRVDAALD